MAHRIEDPTGIDGGGAYWSLRNDTLELWDRGDLFGEISTRGGSIIGWVVAETLLNDEDLKNARARRTAFPGFLSGSKYLKLPKEGKIRVETVDELDAILLAADVENPWAAEIRASDKDSS